MLKRIFLRLLFAAFAAVVLWGFVTTPPYFEMPTVYEEERQARTAVITPGVDRLWEAPSDVTQRNVEENAPILETEGGDILGLMYHDLTVDPSLVHEWNTTPQNLRENLMSLMSLGYLPLSVEDYVEGNYSLAQDYFIVTFDDGYLSNLTLAQPVLEALDVPAAVFVITSGVYADHHMSWEELRLAREGGVLSIYSHTHTHMNARSVLSEVFLADARRAQEELSRNVGEAEYEILSYPNGAYTRETMQALVREGYDLFVVQDWPEWYDPETDGKLLVRVNVSGEDTDMLAIANYSRRRAGLSLLSPQAGNIP